MSWVCMRVLVCVGERICVLVRMFSLGAFSFQYDFRLSPLKLREKNGLNKIIISV